VKLDHLLNIVCVICVSTMWLEI